MARSSQFIQILSSALKTAPVALPSEEALLHPPHSEAQSAGFFYRHFDQCRLPVTLYDRAGRRQINAAAADSDPVFPAQLRMPAQSLSGSSLVVVEDRLFFLYDRVERWPDVPDPVAFLAVHLDASHLAALSQATPGLSLSQATPGLSLAPSEYVLLAHLLSGKDLQAAATAVGAAYDTKRKQIRLVLDKFGAKTQTALLRALTLEITAAVLDEILPQHQRRPETVQLKRQFGRDVVINHLSIGAQDEVAIWEFGARRGQPVLYFHSMLSPILFDIDMVRRLQAQNLRLLLVPRHFSGFARDIDPQVRMDRFSNTLAEIAASLSDAPILCLAESAGVPWAAHFAHHHPAQVSKLVLCATPQLYKAVKADAAPTIFVEMSQRLRSDARVLGGLTQVYNAVSRVPAFAQKGLGHMFRKSEADTACLAALFARAALADWLRLIANHATLASIDEMISLQRDWHADLLGAACPVVMLHGVEDPISPFGDAKALSERSPNVTFEPVENAGHLVLSQAVDRVLPHLVSSRIDTATRS
ncbi:Alpha/beta hydrolase family protein [Aquimixticola soesokkakensis]|uniref:Alpha/beta hydrolase family protein n=1 Tax=Aquimixticola soesokkakensis TaxID=1519096 RepID=A0A1Y5T944_9RHOB|nr:alpha/beta hydrolase [Aquimixticola soesokkakensis]SLN55038.1 Alpha/beta hydrolase family protein [Aquimixticola soesokkakensis]